MTKLRSDYFVAQLEPEVSWGVLELLGGYRVTIFDQDWTSSRRSAVQREEERVLPRKRIGFGPRAGLESTEYVPLIGLSNKQNRISDSLRNLLEFLVILPIVSCSVNQRALLSPIEHSGKPSNQS